MEVIEVNTADMDGVVWMDGWAYGPAPPSSEGSGHPPSSIPTSNGGSSNNNHSQQQTPHSHHHPQLTTTTTTSSSSGGTSTSVASNIEPVAVTISNLSSSSSSGMTMMTAAGHLLSHPHITIHTTSSSSNTNDTANGDMTGTNSNTSTPVVSVVLPDNHNDNNNPNPSHDNHSCTPASAASSASIITIVSQSSDPGGDGSDVSNIVTSTSSTAPSVIATIVSDVDTAAYHSATLPTHQHHHHQQNVRDMDIVHVQWLLENYETAEGVSLPRSTLYTHYQNHCQHQGIEPVNAASFGKLIRSVFVGLRTRRLGTRGNSKYHYYGIRVKPGSSIARLVDSSPSSAPTTPEGGGSSSCVVAPPPTKKMKSSKSQQIHHHHGHHSHGHSNGTSDPSAHHQATLTATSPEILQSYLGDPKSILPNVWPDEPTIPSNTDSDSPSVLATKFAACYRRHYEEIITALGNLQFNVVEGIWMKFWQPNLNCSNNNNNVLINTINSSHCSTIPSSSSTTVITTASDNNNNPGQSNGNQEDEDSAEDETKESSSAGKKQDDNKQPPNGHHQEQQVTNSGQDKRLSLTIEQLHALTTTTTNLSAGDTSDVVTSLSDWIIQTDYTLYNSLITSLLLPSLLKPIPQQLTQSIRTFAKNIGGWMANALNGYDETFVTLKLGAVAAFSHTLRRYTSLNHLSSAARAVLQNPQQISQMISDLNRVDFRNIQEQASWVANCDDQLIEEIESSFKALLQEENPFDRWGSWCLQVLETCLQEEAGDSSTGNVTSVERVTRGATQFFFKWGFYSSLVMRDLTLRSASSFGSFHLIRLLFDEYIFYLIEHRVAKATGKTPLQVIGEARSIRSGLPTSSTQLPPDTPVA